MSIEYLKTLHAIGTCSLEEQHNVSDYIDETWSSWDASVHYYGMCSIGHGSTPLEAIHATIAKRDEKLAVTPVPELVA